MYVNRLLKNACEIGVGLIYSYRSCILVLVSLFVGGKVFKFSFFIWSNNIHK